MTDRLQRTGKSVAPRATSALPLALGLALLAGCAGGSGGGSSAAGGGGRRRRDRGGGGGGTQATYPTSAEYSRSGSLRPITASAAYAAGATGKGTTVAIVDSGIDVGHPEFAGRISSASTDIVTGTSSTLQDPNGHGTHVAGIVGADANGTGVVGVAFDTKLLVIRSDTHNGCPGDVCTYTDADVANAIGYAASHGANVVNLSLGKTGAISAAYQSALQSATSKDVLIVAAAGNRNGSGPDQPASLAGSSSVNGRLIAVGAVTSSGSIASFSDRPANMTQAESYLVAPGVNITSTWLNGGYQSLSGTSMATPVVAGAAADLKSLFPSLSMAQVADLLLSTAKDLGAPGTDLVYGRGLVNLAAAVQPQGGLAVASSTSVDGTRKSLTASTIKLGPAFGDALTGSSSLKHAMALDAYDRPYRVDLSRQVSTASRDLDISGLLAPQGASHATVLPGLGGIAGLRGQLAWQDPTPQGAPAFGLTGEAYGSGRQIDNPSMSLTADTGWGGTVTGGLGVTASAMTPTAADSVEAEGLFWQGGELLAPETALLDRGNGTGLTQPIGGGVTLGVAVFSGDIETGSSSSSEGQLLAAALGRQFGSTSMTLGWSHLEEQGTVLGSTSSGAFGQGEGAATDFLSLGGRSWVAERTELVGHAVMGLTHVSGASGSVDQWSGVASNAFAVGVVQHDTLREGDRIGLIFGQPLRVSSGQATVDVPVSRDLAGNVQRQSEQVGLEPSGRELDLQLAYIVPLGLQSELGSWVMLRSEPGHDSSASPGLAIGARYRLGF